MTISFKRPYTDGLTGVRRELNILLKFISNRERVNLAGIGIIVFKASDGFNADKSPHAHLLLTSQDKPGVNRLSWINRHRGNQLLEEHLPQHDGKVTDSTMLDQGVMTNYLLAPWNINLDSSRTDWFDIFYYRRNLLNKLTIK
ncbi:uncharacterized protein Dvar_56410 [Desulfosarcina variabilis str. Montpellier]